MADTDFDVVKALTPLNRYTFATDLELRKALQTVLLKYPKQVPVGFGVDDLYEIIRKNRWLRLDGTFLCLAVGHEPVYPQPGVPEAEGQPGNVTVRHFTEVTVHPLRASLKETVYTGPLDLEEVKRKATEELREKVFKIGEKVRLASIHSNPQVIGKYILEAVALLDELEGK